MKLLTLICLQFFSVQSAKILGVFPAPGRSQFILSEVLMTELAKRGHEVTVIAPRRPEEEPPNYKTILLKNLREDEEMNTQALYESRNENLFTNIIATYYFGNWITQNCLESEEVQELLHSNAHFDLVVVEQFFNDAMKAFAAHFNAPLVLFSSMGLTEWNAGFMGNPMLPSINPVSYTSFTSRMNFCERLKNTMGTIISYLYREFAFYPVQKQYLKKYFPRPLDFNEINSNASVMLMNSHVTTSENAILPYNMVEIGGFHVVGKPLDKNIQEFLDKASDGAILFSMGSNLRSADLSEENIKAILNVFKRLKQKVLWKFEADLPHKPSNVLISKWLNQRDILAHPNVKLFITHGGMLSVTEATFHGKPMLGIPIFADQRMNIARAKSRGVAHDFSLGDLTEEAFYEAITEVLDNPKYRKNVEQMSKVMKDRPIKPIDLAIYWMEFAIRHNGLKFDAASLYLYWFQVYMFDILLFVLLNVLIVYFVIRKVFSYILNQKSGKTIKKSAKNKKKVQ